MRRRPPDPSVIPMKTQGDLVAGRTPVWVSDVSIVVIGVDVGSQCLLANRRAEAGSEEAHALPATE